MPKPCGSYRLAKGGRRAPGTSAKRAASGYPRARTCAGHRARNVQQVTANPTAASESEPQVTALVGAEGDHQQGHIERDDQRGCQPR